MLPPDDVSADWLAKWAAGGAVVIALAYRKWRGIMTDRRDDVATGMAQGIYKNSIEAITAENTRLRAVIERQEGHIAELGTIIERLRTTVDSERDLRQAAEDREMGTAAVVMRAQNESLRAELAAYKKVVPVLLEKKD
jgi:hypothetical protein